MHMCTYFCAKYMLTPLELRILTYLIISEHTWPQHVDSVDVNIYFIQILQKRKTFL